MPSQPIIEALNMRIANFNIKIEFCQSYDKKTSKNIFMFIKETKQQYLNFLLTTNCKPDYVINIHDRRTVYYKKIEKSYYINFYFYRAKNKIVSYYYISQLQLQLIIRKVLLILLSQKGGFLLHASAIKNKDKCLVISGSSGTGKTTLSKLLMPKLDKFTDDNLIIYPINNKYYCWQTPFDNQDNITINNKLCRLSKLILINKSKKTKLQKITNKKQFMSKLSSQLFPEPEFKNIQVINLIKFIDKFSKFYNLKNGINQLKEVKIVLNKLIQK